MNGHKANGRFIVGINIQSAYRHQITLLVDDHLVMRHRIPRVAFRTFRLMQGLTQHFPAKLIVTL